MFKAAFEILYAWVGAKAVCLASEIDPKVLELKVY